MATPKLSFCAFWSNSKIDLLIHLYPFSSQILRQGTELMVPSVKVSHPVLPSYLSSAKLFFSEKCSVGFMPFCLRSIISKSLIFVQKCQESTIYFYLSKCEMGLCDLFVISCFGLEIPPLLHFGWSLFLIVESGVLSSTGASETGNAGFFCDIFSESFVNS